MFAYVKLHFTLAWRGHQWSHFVIKLDRGHSYDLLHLPLSWSPFCRCEPWCPWPKHPPLHSPWCGIGLWQRGRHSKEFLANIWLNVTYFGASCSEHWGCFLIGEGVLLTRPNPLQWWEWCRRSASQRMLALSPWWQVPLVVSLLLRCWLLWPWCWTFVFTVRDKPIITNWGPNILLPWSRVRHMLYRYQHWVSQNQDLST